jgi:mono/diheme cytochrome c family protein
MLKDRPKRFGLQEISAIFAGILLIAATATCCFSSDSSSDDGQVPARAARKRNPVPPDADSIAAGHKIYCDNCLACHGAGGKGDGPDASSCEPEPEDLTNPDIPAQTDGELFWKISQGSKPMPSYCELLSEKERWTVIDYVRTFAPPSTQPSRAD